MLIPLLIFVACMIAGVWAAAHWLPALAPGPVGGLAFFAVCGLLGAALGLLGLHIYSIVNQLDNLAGLGGISKAGLVTDGLESMLYEAGGLFGLAAVVYLLAPPADPVDIDELRAS